MLFMLFLAGGMLQAQSLKLNPKFAVTIYGTTNVHNFETKVTQLNSEITLDATGKLKSVAVTVPIKLIKSKEKLMDTKTYEAFNADKHPNIVFKMTDLQSVQITGADLVVSLLGNLTMNGVTKKIALKANGKVLKPGQYQLKGSVPLKMTDFGMKPPTAMMGMMKVGDAVTVKYDVILEGDVLSSN